VLVRYIRNQFTDPAPGATAASMIQAKKRSTSDVTGQQQLSSALTIRRKVVRKAFYSDEEDVLDEEDVPVDVAASAPITTPAANSGTGERYFSIVSI